MALSQSVFDEVVDRKNITDISEHLHFFYILWSSIVKEEQISSMNTDDWVYSQTGEREYSDEFYQKIFDRIDDASPYISGNIRADLRVGYLKMDDAQILNIFDQFADR